VAGTAGVVLAAGAGSRFKSDGNTSHKLLTPFRGQPLAHWAIRAAAQAGFDVLVVVCGAVDSSKLAPIVAQATAPLMGDDEVVVVDNPHWADGQSSSLQTGIRVADNYGLDAIVVGLADQPFTSADTWARIGQVQTPIGVAQYGTKRQPPVRLHRSVWPLLPTEGDFGARHLFEQHPQLVSAIVCKDNPVDIDTTEDLRRWN